MSTGFGPHFFGYFDDEGDDEFDFIGSEGFDAIKDMVEAAEAEGLVIEVLYHFAVELQAGSTIQEACNTALDEWDI